jgi:CBS domain-containing protein
VMTTAGTCLDGELSLDEVAQIFEKANLRAAPVVEDEGILIGMVSKSDLARGCRQGEGEERPRSRRFPPDVTGVIAEDVMTPDVVKLRESASLAEAARRFAESGAHRIPVVTTGDVVVGMLSLMDLVRWIARQCQFGA